MFVVLTVNGKCFPWPTVRTSMNVRESAGVRQRIYNNNEAVSNYELGSSIVAEQPIVLQVLVWIPVAARTRTRMFWKIHWLLNI